MLSLVLIKNYTAMIYVNKLYGKYIKAQVTLDDLDYPIPTAANSETVKRIKYFYKPKLESIQTMKNLQTWKKEYHKGNYWRMFQDTHPEIPDHIDMVKQCNLEISEDTVNVFMRIHDGILKSGINDKNIIKDYILNKYPYWKRGDIREMERL